MHWQDATVLEMAQMDEYNTFKDYGPKGAPLPGYKKIRVHLVFDVKHDGRHKALTLSKLWTSNDVNFFKSQSFQVSIPNVSCPGFQVIELSNEKE